MQSQHITSQWRPGCWFGYTVYVQLIYSCWRSSFVQIDVLLPSWLAGRLRSLNTNQQAGHELVFITLSPLYDSQPWLRDQLPDFSFCCTATDSERLWLRGSIRDQPEESLFDGWDQQSPSELANNTCILSVTHTDTRTHTHHAHFCWHITIHTYCTV